MRGKARGRIRGGFRFALVIPRCTGRPPGAEFVRRTEWIGKGWRLVAGGPALCFYMNPIRVIAPGS